MASGEPVKRTALKRKTPMRRTRMVAKPPRRITRPCPGSDPAYLERVRGLPCRAPAGQVIPSDYPFHSGDVVAHHAGPKVNDSTAVPLCWKHHGEWHSANGAFKGWNKYARRMWAEVAIAETRRILGWQL